MLFLIIIFAGYVVYVLSTLSLEPLQSLTYVTKFIKTTIQATVI